MLTFSLTLFPMASYTFNIFSFFQAKPLLKRKKYSELVDPIIRNSYEEEHLRWLVQVTTQCLKKNPKERLSMNMVSSNNL